MTQQVARVRALGALALLAAQFAAGVRQIVRVVFGVFCFAAETAVLDFFVKVCAACGTTPLGVFCKLKYCVNIGNIKGNEELSKFQ
jgi:hypothetical protein